MPARAVIELLGPDPQSASPRFRFDIGSNTDFRLDIGTLPGLPGGAGSRLQVEFHHPGGGQGEVTFSADRWKQLESARVYYYRLLSWGQAVTGMDVVHRFEPELIAVEPDRGSSAGGATVTLVGLGLGRDGELPVVELGGTPATDVRIGARGFVEVTVPAGSVGPAALALRSPTGAAFRVGTTARFEYIPSIARVTFTCPDLDTPPLKSLREDGEWDITTRERRFTIEALARDAAGMLRRPQGRSEVVLEVNGSMPGGNHWEWLDDAAQALAGPLELVDGIGHARLRLTGFRAGDDVALIAKLADQTLVGQRMVPTVRSSEPDDWEVIVLQGISMLPVQLSDLVGPAGPLSLGGIVARDVRGMILLTPIGQIEMAPHDLYLGTDDYRRNPFDNSAVVPHGMLVLLLVRVQDRYGNPVAIDIGTPDRAYRLQLELPGWAVAGTLPFVLAADGRAHVQRNTYFHLRSSPAESRLPLGVTAALVMPAFRTTDTATTTITLRVTRHTREPGGQLEVGDLGVATTFSIDASPSPSNARFSRWFFDGEIDGADQFVAEIGISLVPLVGDGRDLLMYGRQLIAGRAPSDLDHIVAVLALIGLVGDVVTVATGGVGVLADAPIAIMKTSFKVLRSLRKPERGRRLAAVVRQWLDEFFTMPDWRFPDLDALRASASFANLLTAMRRFALLGNRLLNAEARDIERFMSLLGIVVTEVAMLDAVLALAEHYDLYSLMDMLYTTAALDGEDVSELSTHD